MENKRKFVIEAVNKATGGEFDDGSKEFSLNMSFRFQKGLAKLGEGKVRITVEKVG